MPSDSESTATLNLRLHGDAKTMELNVIKGENRIGLAFQAGELEALIAQLADIRSRMIPEVPQQFPHGQPIHDHRGTNYMFGLDPFARVAILSFRSPAFGWLSFSLAEAEIERMYDALQEQKSRPAAPHSDKKH